MTRPDLYFDYAAATPMLPEAIEAMRPFLSERFYNSNALYLGAQANKQKLEESRHIIAMGLGAKPTEVVFTAGGTEANNLAIKGVMGLSPGCEVITCTVEHKSVLEPVKKYSHKIIDVDEVGAVNLDELKKAISDKTVLISIMYANNEIGTIQPIKEIGQIVAKIRADRLARGIDTPIYLHTDACQAATCLDLQVSRLGVDMLTINSGKIYGPKQCGALYVKTGVRLEPQILGGGQEFNLRSGTENLANIVGFAKAFEIVRGDYKNESDREAALRDKLIDFVEHKIPKAVINGPKNKRRLPNNIHFTIVGADAERLLMALDEQGIAVAMGSACGASEDSQSHVLHSIGLDYEQAASSIRVSLGRNTTAESIDILGKTLLKILAIN